jgi:hypothetical protein
MIQIFDEPNAWRAYFFCKNLDSPKPYTDEALKQGRPNDDDALDKKKVMKMVHTIKNLKQRLPSLEINIRLGFQLVVFGLLYMCSGSIPTVIGVYLGYRILRLVLRLFGLLMVAVFTIVSIFVLLIIISLIII